MSKKPVTTLTRVAGSVLILKHSFPSIGLHAGRSYAGVGRAAEFPEIVTLRLASGELRKVHQDQVELLDMDSFRAGCGRQVWVRLDNAEGLQGFQQGKVYKVSTFPAKIGCVRLVGKSGASTRDISVQRLSVVPKPTSLDQIDRTMLREWQMVTLDRDRVAFTGLLQDEARRKLSEALGSNVNANEVQMRAVRRYPITNDLYSHLLFGTPLVTPARAEQKPEEKLTVKYLKARLNDAIETGYSVEEYIYGAAVAAGL